MEKLTKIKNELQNIASRLKNKTKDIKSNQTEDEMKEKAQEITQEKTDFVTIIKNRKEVVTIALLSLVLLVLIVAFIIPTTKNKIITQESQAMIGKNFSNNKQIELIPYNSIENTIVQNERLTLAIIDQKDPNYRYFEEMLLSKENSHKFEEKLYLYPLINEKDDVASYFKIEQGLTLIHFENNKETARKTLTDEDEIKDYLFDYLTSLNAGKSAMTASEEKKDKKNKTDESTSESDSKNNDDIIDELKDITI